MEPQPYFAPATGRTNVTSPDHDAKAASRVAVAEQAAFDRALGRPRTSQSELPPIKEPVLSEDFAQRVADLDQQIFRRGVPVDTDRLLQLGKERFAGLIELDRKVPRGAIGAGLDLTSFESVQRGLHAFEVSPALIARRTTHEQVSGGGIERDQVRRIAGWSDLWKCTSERREVIDDIYAFHDAFESLRFGQSMLEGLAKDGRLRSHFFTGGTGPNVGYFNDWLQGSLTNVKLTRPLWVVLCWLANEKAMPLPVDLAKDFFGVRSPTTQQARLAEAALDGFLLGYDGWPLWEFVGRATRAMPDESRLSVWRTALAARYPRITAFHQELRAGFYVERGFGFDSRREFEPDRYRTFVDRMVETLLSQLSALLALGIAETFPGVTVARFQTGALVEGQCEAFTDKRVSIARQLQAAFPNSNFQLQFAEVKR